MKNKLSLLAGSFLSLVSFVALQGCSGAVPAKAAPTDPAGNFFLVSPGLYRGGRPDQAGVQRLAEMGVKTIINLENDNVAIAAERDWAHAAGLTFVSAPMDGMQAPDDNSVNQVEAMLGDKSQGPFFVHCTKGMDRTGAIIAIDRVVNEGWLPQDAMDEMDAMGFNSILISLKHYVANKIGLG